MGDDAADGEEEEKVDIWTMPFEEYKKDFIYDGGDDPDPEEGIEEMAEKWEEGPYKAMLDRLNTGSNVVYGKAKPDRAGGQFPPGEDDGAAPVKTDAAQKPGPPQYRSADIGAVHVRDPSARVVGVKHASDEELLRIIKGGRFLGTSFNVSRCAGKDQLYFAAQKGREMIVRALLQPGVDPFKEPAADIDRPYGYDLTTPLYAASRNAHHGGTARRRSRWRRNTATTSSSGCCFASGLTFIRKPGMERLHFTPPPWVDTSPWSGRCSATAPTQTPSTRRARRRCTSPPSSRIPA
jgi:hypothetical protein